MRWMATFWASLTALVAVSFGASGVGYIADPDEAAWREAKRAATHDAYQRYLDEFPAGRHIGDAFRGIVEQATDQQIVTARFKDKGQKGRPEVFGPPGKPAIGPPGLY